MRTMFNPPTAGNHHRNSGISIRHCTEESRQDLLFLSCPDFQIRFFGMPGGLIRTQPTIFGARPWGY